MLIWPFRRNEANTDAARLLEAVVEASRRPGFYGPGRASDTLEGRFELLTLHAALVLTRLVAPETKPLAQAFTDILFRHIDSGLREAGVGDLAVPKRMRRLAGDFYGRVNAYAGAIKAGDAAALAAAVERNVLGDGARGGFGAEMAGYALNLAACQAGAPVAALGEMSAWEGAFA
jgi:cytochrome b pre-mRNA-processing protein 3